MTLRLSLITILCVACVYIHVIQGQQTPKYVGAFNTYHHFVSGHVYVLSATSFYLQNFNYEGGAPGAFFYVGPTSQVNLNGTYAQLPDERGTYNSLGSYFNTNLILHLPAGIKVHQVNWLSVYCKDFQVDFGSVFVPQSAKNYAFTLG